MKSIHKAVLLNEVVEGLLMQGGEKHSRKSLSEPIQQNRAWLDRRESETHRQQPMTACLDGSTSLSEQNSKLLSLVHKTIKKVSEDIENMRFNTAVSALMILLNELEKEPAVTKEDYRVFLQLLAPFAPHITEELWANIGNKKSIHGQLWPAFDAALLVESTAKIAIQINGKTRAEMEIARDVGEESVKAAALALDIVKKWLNGKVPSRIIVVKERLVNIVVQG